MVLPNLPLAFCAMRDWSDGLIARHKFGPRKTQVLSSSDQPLQWTWVCVCVCVFEGGLFECVYFGKREATHFEKPSVALEPGGSF